MNEFGCEASWLLDVVNVVTGNLDRPGGAMWATPPLDLGGLGRLFGLNEWGRHRSRVRGLPEFGGQLPIATLADEIETPGDGQVRASSPRGNPARRRQRRAPRAASRARSWCYRSLVNETRAPRTSSAAATRGRPQLDVVCRVRAVRTASSTPHRGAAGRRHRDYWRSSSADPPSRRSLRASCRAWHPTASRSALRLGKICLTLAKVGATLTPRLGSAPGVARAGGTPGRACSQPRALVDGLDRLERTRDLPGARARPCSSGPPPCAEQLVEHTVTRW